MCRLIRKRKSQLIMSMGLKSGSETKQGTADKCKLPSVFFSVVLFPGAIYNLSEACGEDYCEVLL